MDHCILIWSVAVFVENRLESGFDYAQLEKAAGYSLAHIRDVFSRLMGTTLSRYVLGRRVAHAAFDMIHSSDSLLNIAGRYGFENPDTFTRAFYRMTGLMPR